MGRFDGKVALITGAARGQGRSHALALAADNFKTYLLQRANDLPQIEILHQSTPSPASILGTKGVGETGVRGAIAAVLNAVNDVLRPHGASIHRLPLTPPNVPSAIRAADLQRPLPRVAVGASST